MRLDKETLIKQALCLDRALLCSARSPYFQQQRQQSCHHHRRRLLFGGLFSSSRLISADPTPPRLQMPSPLSSSSHLRRLV